MDFLLGVLANIVAGLASILIGWAGFIFGMLVKAVMFIGSYNQIIDSAPVEFGWVIVRDVANMFFIVVLLFIAIGTLFHQETYSWKKALPRFILAIVLINFSRLIAGVMIDFAQVIMMTFMNAIAAAGHGNIADLLRIDKILSINPDTLQEVNPWTIAVAYLLGLLLLIIVDIVMAAMVIILAFRIIQLWFAVVLFPLAIMLSAWPGGKAGGYYSDWWKKFTDNLIVGPVLAFFLWLALMSATFSKTIVEKQIALGGKVLGGEGGGLSAFASLDVWVSFIIGIGMLVLGTKMAVEMGAVGGGLAQSALGWLQQKGVGLLKGTAKAPFGAYAWAARKVKAGKLPGEFLKGLELNPANIYRNLKAGFEKKKKDEETEGMVAAGQVLEKGGVKGLIGGLGAAGWVNNYARGVLYLQGWQRLFLGRRKGLENLQAKQKEAEDKAAAARQQMENIENPIFERIKNDRDTNPNSQYQGWSDEALRNSARVSAMQGPAYAELTRTEREANLEAAQYKAKADEKARYVPVDYYARAEQRSLIAERAKRVDAMKTEELVAAAQAARFRKDPFELAAVLMQAAKMGDINDVSKSMGYGFSNKGFNNLINDVLIKELKFNPQAAYSLQRDISNVVWGKQGTIMESTGVRNGIITQLSEKEQVERAVYESLKGDMERAARERTRLGYCDEVWDAQEGKFIAKVNDVGKGIILNTWEAMKVEVVTRKRFNKDAAYHMAQGYNMKEIRSLANKIDAAKRQEFLTFVDELEKYGKRPT